MDDELLLLTRRILDAIAAGDWECYASLSSPEMTCFEPESCGTLVEGLGFHRFYFEPPRGETRRVDHILHPRVTALGPDAAIVTYVRLAQWPHESRRYEETRVWQRTAGGWRQVHVHRSVH